jgi:hypothetical protein
MASSIVEKFYNMEYGLAPVFEWQLEHHVSGRYSAAYRHPIA